MELMAAHLALDTGMGAVQLGAFTSAGTRAPRPQGASLQAAGTVTGQWLQRHMP